MPERPVVCPKEPIMHTVFPCLWFDTEGEQAARFYTSLVPNSRITKVTRYTVPTPSPNEVGTVLTVDFELNGSPFRR